MFVLATLQQLKLVEEVSQLFTVPLQKWIAEEVIFKFWGDKLHQKRGVCDVCSDHQGHMIHTYSMLVGHSCTPAIELPRTGHVAPLNSLPADVFLPTASDSKGKSSRHCQSPDQYIHHLSPLSKSIPKLLHKYSGEMSHKSVVVLDVLMKNEAKHSDMQEYLGKNYPSKRRVASGGDQLTCERQFSAQRHMMDGDTPEERLQLQ